MIPIDRTFFAPREAIAEGNPQAILERGETVALVPFLIMQGAASGQSKVAFRTHCLR
jgi:hypothetical protein